MKTKNIKMKTLSCLALLAFAFLTARAAPPDDAVKNVVITSNDALRFSVTKIEAKPGEKLHVVLKNEGTMPKDIMGHNWILLKAGKSADAYDKAALSAKAENYQPKALADQVLAVIPLLGPKENGECTFTAPTEPGTYPYLCACPAHEAAGMRGTLVVK
jgi:azurin